jgi:hypothetical protein
VSSRKVPPPPTRFGGHAMTQAQNPPRATVSPSLISMSSGRVNAAVAPPSTRFLGASTSVQPSKKSGGKGGLAYGNAGDHASPQQRTDALALAGLEKGVKGHISQSRGDAESSQTKHERERFVSALHVVEEKEQKEKRLARTPEARKAREESQRNAANLQQNYRNQQNAGATKIKVEYGILKNKGAGFKAQGKVGGRKSYEIFLNSKISLGECDEKSKEKLLKAFDDSF